MHFAYTVTTQTTQARATIDCPACGARSVSSTATESIERAKFMAVIPIVKLTHTSVTCGGCRQVIATTAPFQTLVGAAPDDIAPFLRYKPSAAAKRLALMAVALSVVPVVGLLLAAAACYVSRGTRGWPASLSMLALMIAAAMNITIVLVIFVH